MIPVIDVTRIIGISIPYRYCENLPAKKAQAFYSIRFQFLIGTVKINLLFSGGSLESVFQFLIGTVKI